MQIYSVLSLAISVLPTITTSHPTSSSQDSTPCPDPVPLTRDHRAKIVGNYLRLWGGDRSILKDTFSPEIMFHADRLPSPTGVGSEALELNTPVAFGDFVLSSRKGWEHYGFIPTYWFGEDDRVAIRWRLDGVIGKGAIASFGATVKPGSKITYNGTDILTLNCCTGLVDQVDSAQDFIDFFHVLGLKKISV